MRSAAIKFLILGIAILVLTLPLILRIVPMNHLYGFRTRAAFRSEENWYEINTRGGVLLGLGSLAIIAVGLTGFLLPDKYTLAYVFAAVLVIVTAVMVPILILTAWHRKFGS
jgi:uncharacterized membrane protein